MSGTTEVIGERKLLALVGAVQFVNVLDFMMVMPLGPDFAKALGVPSSELGLVGGVYTAAAAVSGLIGALFLDRFDRRKALACALFGLMAGTALGGFAVDLPTLLLARVAAGVFGGPATALSLAIVADGVPPERRGRAMGTIMSAFSVASILGVPAGLALAELGGWRAPFFAVAALGAVVGVVALIAMPPFTGHLVRAEAREPEGAGVGFGFLVRGPVLLALCAVTVAMMGSFSMIPNMSAYFQGNLAYPRERLGLLYMLGGGCTLVTMRVAGLLTDRIGPAATATLGNLAFALVLYVGFIEAHHALPPMLLFVGFMTTSSFRMVPMQALSSRVPHERERARFMSASSAVQHLASASGAMLSSRMLGADPSGKLVGMERVALLALVLVLLLPVILYRLQTRVAGNTQAR
ncbi:MAG: MFS transporter [Polyangiales bacterium]